jgi:hypothetical protein
MTIKPTRAHEGMHIYYILNGVNPLYVSITFFDSLKGGVLRSIYNKDISTNVQI